jgi:hypothetical protein
VGTLIVTRRLGEFDLDQMRRHRAAVGRGEIDLGIAGLFLSLAEHREHGC